MGRAGRPIQTGCADFGASCRGRVAVPVSALFHQGTRSDLMLVRRGQARLHEVLGSCTQRNRGMDQSGLGRGRTGHCLPRQPTSGRGPDQAALNGAKIRQSTFYPHRRPEKQRNFDHFAWLDTKPDRRGPANWRQIPHCLPRQPLGSR